MVDLPDDRVMRALPSSFAVPGYLTMSAKPRPQLSMKVTLPSSLKVSSWPSLRLTSYFHVPACHAPAAGVAMISSATRAQTLAPIERAMSTARGRSLPVMRSNRPVAAVHHHDRSRHIG